MKKTFKPKKAANKKHPNPHSQRARKNKKIGKPTPSNNKTHNNHKHQSPKYQSSTSHSASLQPAPTHK